MKRIVQNRGKDIGGVSCITKNLKNKIKTSALSF